VTGPQAETPLKTRDQALVLLGALFERDEFEALTHYLPSGRQEEVLSWATTLQEMPGKERVRFILGRLKSIVDTAYFEKIEEIHPTWVARFLEKEPAPLAGLVLKSLPSKYIAKVAKAMNPKMTKLIRTQLKGISPSPRVRDLFLMILIRHFNLINRLSGIGADPFEMLFFPICKQRRTQNFG